MLPEEILKTDVIVKFELFLTFIASVTALFLSKRCVLLGSSVSRIFDKIASKRLLSIILVMLLAFCGSMAVSLIVRFPEPTIHDEFSYLLAADTFASGRLANPTHPMWPHFEILHIIQKPNYASKYPPGQGLMLAFGKVVGGHPIVGVWLSIAICCASICWMLQGWVPNRWALLGGILAALNLGFFGYWSQKYWGGAVAATGGAFVFGSLRRLIRRPEVRISLILGVGLIILTNSRPFEGLITSLPVALVLVIWILKSKSMLFRQNIFRLILPILGILLLGAIWSMFYNYRVTGDILKLPYQVYNETYGSTPIFIWSKINLPTDFPNQAFRDLYRNIADSHNYMNTLQGFIHAKVFALSLNLAFFFRGVFLVPLLTLPTVYRSRWNIFAILVICLVGSIVLLQTQSSPRKIAPVTCLIILILIQSLRQLRICSWRGKPIGRCIFRLLLIIFFVSIVISFSTYFHDSTWAPSRQRSELMHKLTNDSARHLIIVRYGPNHFPHFDWVYNSADIDSSKIIWAKELGFEQNRKLLEYYNDRKIWLLKADQWVLGQVKLLPYPSH